MIANLNALSVAWKRWERWPADPHSANGMEAAATTVAGDLGVTTTDLRERLIDLRREGASIEQALAIVSAGGGLAVVPPEKGACGPLAVEGDPTAPAEPFEKLPMTFVACRSCSELIGIHEVVCPYCGQPEPRRVAEVA